MNFAIVVPPLSKKYIFDDDLLILFARDIVD